MGKPTPPPEETIKAAVGAVSIVSYAESASAASRALMPPRQSLGCNTVWD
jgi:hypothetical protein